MQQSRKREEISKLLLVLDNNFSFHKLCFDVFHLFTTQKEKEKKKRIIPKNRLYY